jgi:chaperonin GroES
MAHSKAFKDSKDAAQTPLDKVRIPFDKLLSSPNVADLLPADALEQVGLEAVYGYREDRNSRKQWEMDMAEAVKLAMQVKEVKNFPWANASNIKFPLVTIGALQFLARVSLLTDSERIVNCSYYGVDPKGERKSKCERIAEHFQFQLTQEDVDWADQDEITKLTCAIMGVGFKKTTYDHLTGITSSVFRPCQNVVVNYHATSFTKAQRVTDLIYKTDNEIHEMWKQGLYRRVDSSYKPSEDLLNLMDQAFHEANGQAQTDSSDSFTVPFTLLEQNTWLDLDGDGYKEPYVVTVKADSGQCLRIVADFYDKGDVYRKNDAKIRSMKQMEREAQTPEGKASYGARAAELTQNNDIVRIDKDDYWTRYIFVPNPDGGFYGYGLGRLLGPLNASANTLINQLVDKGTMMNTAGGFLGKGVKMKGGKTSFDPFEWKPVDSTGDDLRKSIMPLPVSEPSPILFQLLGMLVQYGERISGATDIMTGQSPGQNTPAETTRQTVEQGTKLFSGIYCRMHRSFTHELRARFRLNKLFFESSPQFFEQTQGKYPILAKDDYQDESIRVYPEADPAVSSEEMRKQQGILLYNVSKESPLVNKYEALTRFLKANRIKNLELLAPDPKGPDALPPPVNPKVEIEKSKLQLAAQQHADKMQLQAAEFQQQQMLVEAKIVELQAKASKENAEAAGVDTGHRIALLNAQIAALKEEHTQMGAISHALLKIAEMRHQQEMDVGNLELERDRGKSNAKTGGTEGMGQ